MGEYKKIIQILKTPKYYLQPLNDAQHSLECRFNHKNYQINGDEDILASATHFNNSHVLTMTLWRDVQWRAEWLNRSDTSPPTAMIVNLVSMSYSNAKKLVTKTNFDRIAATKYRKNYCQSLQEVKQVQRNVQNWEDDFATGKKHALEKYMRFLKGIFP